MIWVRNVHSSERELMKTPEIKEVADPLNQEATDPP